MAAMWVVNLAQCPHDALRDTGLMETSSSQEWSAAKTGCAGFISSSWLPRKGAERCLNAVRSCIPSASETIRSTQLRRPDLATVI